MKDKGQRNLRKRWRSLDKNEVHGPKLDPEPGKNKKDALKDISGPTNKSVKGLLIIVFMSRFLILMIV